MKIAVYTCNFGNYRKEFLAYYSTIFAQNIDYYLFTDIQLTHIEKSKLKGFHICNIETLPSDDIMDGNRWTSKFVKFILPDVLQQYDIIIWIDNKIFREKNIMKNITYEKIEQLFYSNPNVSVFNIQHRERKTIHQELMTTIKIENSIPGTLFLDKIKNYKSTFDLPDTCIIIRKNDSTINNTFRQCFDLMKEYKLKRDQNIYNYALDNNGVKPILLELASLNVNTSK
jgi:hypothetical protein